MNFKKVYFLLRISLLKQTLNTELYTDLMIINNLKKNDRSTKDEFPYKIDVDAKFYDITDFYYQFAAIDKMYLQGELPIDNYPGQIIESMYYIHTILDHQAAQNQ